ncbi:MAG: hypothetical protein IT249_17455, partial [Chitinophagaceae bacterium]|nr:hypothetical protein [Chitinophagaceae bacterium]
MKLKNMLFLIAALSTLSLVSISAQSQVQIGVNGGRLEGTGSSQWGFGAHIKYLIADKFAIGVAARGYPKNVKTSDVSFGGNNYKMAQG